MAENKMCPHCGGQMFMAKITKPCVVEVITESNEPYKVLKESHEKFDIELLKCARCKADVTEESLIVGVKCKECGRIVGPMDIDEHGTCNVCTAIRQRTELANASKEDLIKMLLDAEKKANPVSAKIEKQIEKAENVAVETEQPDNTEKKAKNKPTRKKKEDKVSSEETVQEATKAEEIDNLANQQDAPFPDMNLPEENVQEPEPLPNDIIENNESEPINQEEQAVGADFHMFDDGEEPF